jgi:FixJ family two-component response regulator
VVLPGRENGIGFAYELRTTHPDLPVTLMSGHPKELMQVREDTELDLVPLKKPFRRDELSAALKAGIERKNSQN